MTTHPSLANPPADLIGDAWVNAESGDADLISRNPARPANIIWKSHTSPAHVPLAIEASRRALSTWSRWPQSRRFDVLRRYRSLCVQHADRIADLICDETGKVMWDAKSEAGALAAKVDITLDDSPTGPLRRVSTFEVPLAESRLGRCWFRPHGVMAVLAPFNFPAHLANGHIVPALAMGNTIILKSSDKTPAVGQLIIELLLEALRTEGAPPGVVNLVQGGPDVAKALVAHEDIDGILFTGSWPVGRSILQANLDRPGRIIALEMGGNNAAAVMPDADLRQAAIECARSAFVTTGQRCTCTRRVIVHSAIAARFIPAVCKAASNLIIGDPRASHPVFMGPMIDATARDRVLAFQSAAAKAGAEVLVQASAIETPEGGAYITPSVMRVDRFSDDDGEDPGADVEVFGPLLRIAVVDSLDQAIAQTNATRFGLAASIFTKDAAAVERFLHEARAGCVNVNTGTAGASSKLPFGGLGLSGNHRPAGAFSLDYCAYPVAGMIEQGAAATIHPGMKFDDSWLK